MMYVFSIDPLDLGFDDDQHDYDSVASDDDTDSELTTQNNNNTQRNNRAKVTHLSKNLLSTPNIKNKLINWSLHPTQGSGLCERCHIALE